MAKSARGSSEDLFSISGGSEALSSARRTIAKALAGVKPDAVRNGLKLWRMRTIIENVNRRTEAPILTTATTSGSVLTGVAADTERAFRRYDAAYDAMCALPSLAARRAAAHQLEPLLREALSLMHDRDVECDLHPEHIELKNDRVRQLMTLGLEGPCEWSHSQA